MRILDEDNDRSCERVTCFLTRSEAAELRDSLDALLARGAAHQHQHVPGEDLAKEITVCLCSPDDLSHFDAARAARRYRGLTRGRGRDMDLAIAAYALEHGRNCGEPE